MDQSFWGGKEFRTDANGNAVFRGTKSINIVNAHPTGQGEFVFTMSGPESEPVWVHKYVEVV